MTRHRVCSVGDLTPQSRTSATSTRSILEHTLFVDGTLQTWHRPSAVFLCVLHLECACATITVYVVLWETWYTVRSARGSGNLGDGHRVVSRPLAVLVLNMSEFPLIHVLHLRS